YRDQARELLAAGVSGIMLETFTSTRALAPALEGALDAADGMPVLVSFAIDDAGDLLGDGLNIEAACMFAQERGACSVGVNCCSVEAATAAVPRMVRAVPLPVSVRPNAGYPERADDGAPVWREQPEAFAAACPRWVADGA
ncbi:homocysteine S-methyltransferase family protein, partial [Candidatus Collinsella stercoripullorum]|uniref:homocysteine S-methyltransferase family protein n=1 Tax=Candidatus Collinsella stercoripullorum TaxID=2838522 RepID=UPI0022E8D08F